MLDESSEYAIILILQVSIANPGSVYTKLKDATPDGNQDADIWHLRRLIV